MHWQTNIIVRASLHTCAPHMFLNGCWCGYNIGGVVFTSRGFRLQINSPSLYANAVCLSASHDDGCCNGPIRAARCRLPVDCGEERVRPPCELPPIGGGATTGAARSSSSGVSRRSSRDSAVGGCRLGWSRGGGGGMVRRGSSLHVDALPEGVLVEGGYGQGRRAPEEAHKRAHISSCSTNFSSCQSQRSLPSGGGGGGGGGEAVSAWRRASTTWTSVERVARGQTAVAPPSSPRRPGERATIAAPREQTVGRSKSCLMLKRAKSTDRLASYAVGVRVEACPPMTLGEVGGSPEAADATTAAAPSAAAAVAVGVTSRSRVANATARRRTSPKRTLRQTRSQPNLRLRTTPAAAAAAAAAAHVANPARPGADNEAAATVAPGCDGAMNEIIIQWLIGVEQAGEAPPTPDSIIDEPLQTDTAIHVVYHGD